MTTVQETTSHGWNRRTVRAGLTAGVVALLAAGCQDSGPAGPSPVPTAVATTQAASMTAPFFTAASGTVTQTAVLSEEVRFAGPNVILETTIAGTISGTLSGTVEDSFRLVIHPNDTFTAQGTTICVCTVDGRSGTLELRLTDTGEIVDGTPVFTGRSVIQRGTGELAGLRGVIELEGTVNLMTGLSTIDYSGWIRFGP
jgi:hypothetical protein